MNEVMAVALAVVLAVLSVVWNALDFKLILNITLGSALATLALGLIGVLAQLEQSKAVLAHLEQSKALLVRIAMRARLVGARLSSYGILTGAMAPPSGAPTAATPTPSRTR